MEKTDENMIAAIDISDYQPYFDTTFSVVACYWHSQQKHLITRQSQCKLSSRYGTIKGMVSPEETSPRSHLQIGARGRVADIDLHLQGYIRNMASDDDDTWYWEEWYCGTVHDQEIWIEFDEESGEYTLFKKFPDVTANQDNNGQLGRNIQLSSGESFYVTEKADATIIAALGYLPEGHELNTQFTYYESSTRRQQSYTVEVSDEVEVFKGEKMHPKELFTALQLQSALNKWEWAQQLEKRNRFVEIISWMVAAVCIVAVVMGLVSGTTVYEQSIVTCTSTKTACGTEEIQVGPFRLEKVNRAHRIEIEAASGISAQNWQSVLVTLMNKDQQPVSAMSGEFWLENWVEDGERGTDSNTSAKKYFRLTQEGQYYAKINVEPASSSARPLVLKFKVVENVYYWPYFTTLLSGGVGLGLLKDKNHRILKSLFDS